ncbi:DUF1904 domain-containing protein [Gemella sp. zg-570]|uniref:DUF1904 family protein n=1 Tax=Gemella sp. zg-570 TaxID=2840371 RepID=UPI001C0C8021|nr:DUF1904 family protein [Gemella sp. zg-570]QWQ38863.1 DUF1904 domain-containing protein [Gemella sp. zg-570]
MPRIVVKGMQKADLKAVSTELLERVEKIIARPKNAFTLDLLESVAIYDGLEISRVYVEVSWKSRPVEVCKEVAESINNIIKKAGYEKVFVYFKDLDLEKEFEF